MIEGTNGLCLILEDLSTKWYVVEYIAAVLSVLVTQLIILVFLNDLAFIYLDGLFADSNRP